MIEIVDLWHHYGLKPTLRGVSLRVGAGEIVVIMGPNGVGKSTLLSIAAGVLPPFRGHVEIDGLRRRRTIDEEKKARQKTVYLVDNPWLPDHATCSDYILTLGRIYDVEEDRLVEHTNRLLDLFDLRAHADQSISGLSAGQRKKVAICGALATDAPVMILDEPFSGGLDSSGLHTLQRVLRSLAQSRGATMLLAVPVPELVDGLADRVAVLKEGSLLACDTPANLKQSQGTATLSEALEKILNPGKGDRLGEYLTEPGKA